MGVSGTDADQLKELMEILDEHGFEVDWVNGVSEEGGNGSKETRIDLIVSRPYTEHIQKVP